MGPGLGLEGGELDATVASGLPVLAVGGDFNGEDGVRAELGLEEAQEFLCYDCLWNVRDPHCGSLHCRDPQTLTEKERETVICR